MSHECEIHPGQTWCRECGRQAYLATFVAEMGRAQERMGGAARKAFMSPDFMYGLRTSIAASTATVYATSPPVPIPFPSGCEGVLFGVRLHVVNEPNLTIRFE